MDRHNLNLSAQTVVVTASILTRSLRQGVEQLREVIANERHTEDGIQMYALDLSARSVEVRLDAYRDLTDATALADADEDLTATARRLVLQARHLADAILEAQIDRITA